MAQTINLDTSQRVHIICKRGDTFELQLTLKDSGNNSIISLGEDGTGGGTGPNEDDSFKMEVRTADYEDTAYGTGGDNNDGIILSTEDDGTGPKQIDVVMDSNADTTGTVKFFVDAATMATVSSGIYVYDIEMTDVSESNKVTTLIYGTFKVNEDVSV